MKGPLDFPSLAEAPGSPLRRKESERISREMKLAGVLQIRQDSVFSGSSWQSRYFNLQGDKLFYFRSKTTFEHEGFIVLRQIKHISEKEDNKILIELDDQKEVWLRCGTPEQARAWIEALTRITRVFQADWNLVHADALEKELTKEVSTKSILGSSRSILRGSTGTGSNTPELVASPRVPAEELNGDPNELQKKVIELTKKCTEQADYIEQLKKEQTVLETKYKELLEKEKESFKGERKKFELESEKIIELQEAYEEKADKVQTLEKKFKEMELEIINMKERELSERNRVFMNRQSDNETKLQTHILKLQEKLFFSLAMNVKMMGTAPQCNVNALYQQALLKGVEVDQYDSWIWAHCNDPELKF